MIKIKRIDISEIDLVVDLFDKYRVFYQQISDLSLAKEFIHARLSNQESVIFVALNEETKPVGFTQLYPTSSARAVKNWILNDLYVEASYRQQGIGNALIQTAINFTKENKAKFVELSTAVDNDTAQSLYEKIGFEKQPPDTKFYTYRINI
jgi:ribosomal protein S18 acetylase RimI-like enzyme